MASAYNSSISRDFDYLIKAVLIGDLGVGKTTFLDKFRDEKYSDINSRRNSIESKRRTFVVQNRNVKFELWDTAGQEKYRSLTASYYRGAKGCVILFDVTDAETFENANRWYEDLKEYSDQKEIATVLVGTKISKQDREVSQATAQAFADNHGIMYKEADIDSASVNQICEELINIALDKIVRSPINSYSMSRSEISRLGATPKRKKSWCGC